MNNTTKLPGESASVLKRAAARPKQPGARLVAIEAAPPELTRPEVRLLTAFRKASPAMKQMVTDMLEDYNASHPHRSAPRLTLVCGGGR
jgi:hypothetical protein